jgi:hypothetical protein
MRSSNDMIIMMMMMMMTTMTRVNTPCHTHCPSPSRYPLSGLKICFTVCTLALPGMVTARVSVIVRVGYLTLPSLHEDRHYRRRRCYRPPPVIIISSVIIIIITSRHHHLFHKVDPPVDVPVVAVRLLPAPPLPPHQTGSAHAHQDLLMHQDMGYTPTVLKSPRTGDR